MRKQWFRRVIAGLCGRKSDEGRNTPRARACGEAGSLEESAGFPLGCLYSHLLHSVAAASRTEPAGRTPRWQLDKVVHYVSRGANASGEEKKWARARQPKTERMALSRKNNSRSEGDGEAELRKMRRENNAAGTRIVRADYGIFSVWL